MDKDQETLEAMIDRLGLGAVLERIGQVCFDKEDHLSSNWQEQHAAKGWAEAGLRISELGQKDHYPYRI